MNKFLIIILIFLVPAFLEAQVGMTLDELSKKIEKYFDKELIGDLEKQLPDAKYAIWGWDVGDFSGDGFSDIAFTVRMAGERGKKVNVYLFADIDGYLTNIAQFPYEYYEIPLEIGVVIRDTTCYITKKREQFNWVMRGYRFDVGSVVLVDEFTTSKIDKYTRETYRNFQTLRGSDRFFNASRNKPELLSQYLTIPSYPKGRYIYKGFAKEVEANSIDFVGEGAYYWGGDADASYNVNSTYDEEALTLVVRVNDDVVVPDKCDSCVSDYLQIWLDTNPVGSERLYSKEKKKFAFRKQGDTGIFAFTIRPGDFLKRRASVQLATDDKLTIKQQAAAQEIRATSGVRDNGYLLKVRIPFALLGISVPKAGEAKPIEVGCSVALHDIDNEFRPEEKSVIATSVFKANEPASYGVLTLVPQEAWYGEAENVYLDPLLKTLTELGF
ncbi:MAG: sugar-binding protein [Bacteroidota bacterium]